jgi:hypothetical protein
MATETDSGDLMGYPSKSVLAGEKDPTELDKGDLRQGFCKVDLKATLKKVLIPGEHVRQKAEQQYGVREVTG